MENISFIDSVIAFFGAVGTLYLSPLAGFALLDLLNCIRENKPFWLPSKIIVVLFVWALGWQVYLNMM